MGGDARAFKQDPKDRLHLGGQQYRFKHWSERARSGPTIRVSDQVVKQNKAQQALKLAVDRAATKEAWLQNSGPRPHRSSE